MIMTLTYKLYIAIYTNVLYFFVLIDFYIYHYNDENN